MALFAVHCSHPAEIPELQQTLMCHDKAILPRLLRHHSTHVLLALEY